MSDTLDTTTDTLDVFVSTEDPRVFMERESNADGLLVQVLVTDEGMLLHVIDPMGEVLAPIPGGTLEDVLNAFDHPYATVLAGRNPWPRSCSTVTDADEDDVVIPVEDLPTAV